MGTSNSDDLLLSVVRVSSTMILNRLQTLIAVLNGHVSITEKRKELAVVSVNELA
jgi:hypothetical protein